MQLLKRGEPLEKASKGIILLHGRGSNATDIMHLSTELNVDGCYLVAPETPHHVWYPHRFMDEDHLNEPYLTRSIALVKQLIDEMILHIPKAKIYLMGFSQGACLALETSARYGDKYGGIVAFSGALIGQHLDKRKYSGNFNGTQIFIGNSDIDPHIPLGRTIESKTLLEERGAKVTLKIYPGLGHHINADEINTVNQLMFNE